MSGSRRTPDRDRLLELIVELAVVHGKVTLSSGREADWYIDMRRLTLHHEGAPLVGRVMRQLTGDLRYDVVGGLTLGADPVATAMLHAAADGEGFLDACVVRKAGKAHGLQRRIEGPDVEGRSVLVVEDVSTTGGSPLTAAEALQEAGAEVIGGGGHRQPRRAARPSRRPASSTGPPTSSPTSASTRPATERTPADAHEFHSAQTLGGPGRAAQSSTAPTDQPRCAVEVAPCAGRVQRVRRSLAVRGR